MTSTGSRAVVKDWRSSGGRASFYGNIVASLRSPSYRNLALEMRWTFVGFGFRRW